MSCFGEFFAVTSCVPRVVQFEGWAGGFIYAGEVFEGVDHVSPETPELEAG